MKRVVFMGSSPFAASVFLDLHLHYSPVCIYTSPPRPAGRGMKICFSAVHAFAEEHSYPVRYPHTLKDENIFREFLELEPDLVVVVAYGLMIPSHYLAMVPWGFLNLHASLLPRWRGAAPIHRAILSGDSCSGVAVMQMVKELDCGPVWKETSVKIEGLHYCAVEQLLMKEGVKLLLTVLDQRFSGSLKIPTLQSKEGVTYAHKITKEEGRLDWGDPAEVLLHKIRAFSSGSKAYTFYRDKVIKILDAEMSEDRGGRGGEILDSSLWISCGKGSLRPTVLQKEGGKPLCVQDFLNGFSIKIGDRFL